VEGSDALFALSEVAIGVAGFSAVALVLSRNRDSLSPELLFIIRTSSVNGVTVAFLALFPWVLTYASLSPAGVWRWSSGAVLFSILFIAWTVVVRDQRVLGSPHDTGIFRMNVVAWDLIGFSTVVHSGNLLGWPCHPSFSAFYLGLWLSLSVAGIAFCFLIYRLLR
jgi:hypothetical protein